MERIIFHIDCDSFYASVEELYHPEHRGMPIAVGGSPENRHGIILAKTQPAKALGVKTGEPLWEALRKCPNLIIFPPDFKKYMRFSGLVRNICLRYTDFVEPFGLDESWLDVTDCAEKYGGGYALARRIQQTVLEEVGITVSIGISFNKVFAKLGSDYKKPFGITEITRKNYRKKVWELPVNDLLMIGRATKAKLNKKGIQTIGQLANTGIENLKRWFGKNGYTLYAFANGEDRSPVARYSDARTIKSIGNSATLPRDAVTPDEVKEVIFVLAEAVARRLRAKKLKGRVISVSMKNSALYSFTRQRRIEHYTNITSEIAKTAFELFKQNYNWELSVRSLGVCISDLESEEISEQICMFSAGAKREKLESLDKTVDDIKRRFGNYSVQRACLLSDEEITRFNPHDDHIVFPKALQ